MERTAAWLTASSAWMGLPAAETRRSGGEEGGDGWSDAHVHLWTSDLRRYPLAEGYDRGQMHPASFTPAEFFSHARRAGVARAVLIQMSYYGDDNRYMLDCMRAQPQAFAGVAVVDSHSRSVRQKMLELKKEGVRGFRLRPEGLDEQRWLEGGGIEAMFRCGADEGLAMCCLIDAPQLVGVERLCRRFRQTPLVVDHLARIGIDGTVREEDVKNLCRLAAFPHVAVKVSAFYALGQKRAPYTDLAPLVRRVYEAFGPQRLMWGSDCPFQVEGGHNYQDSSDLVSKHLDFLSPEDKNWLLGRTAERIFFALR